MIQSPSHYYGKHQAGNLVSDPVCISGIFKRFYCNRYSSESQSVSDEMLAFLRNSDLSTVTKSVSDKLDTPIKIEEIFCLNQMYAEQ